MFRSFRRFIGFRPLIRRQLDRSRPTLYLMAASRFRYGRFGPFVFTAVPLALVSFQKGKCASFELPTIFDFIRMDDSGKLKQVLDASFDPDTQHELGWAALHLASVNGSTKCVKLLIEYGCDVNIADTYFYSSRRDGEGKLNCRIRQFSELVNPTADCRGTTALHYAVLLNHVDTVKVLLDAGANPKVANHVGHRPVDYAQDETMRQLLEDYSNNYEQRKREREAELRRKFPLEQALKDNVIAQENAIHVVAQAIRRKENGWSSDENPLVFLFLGSSGIGKTELAKQVAKYLHRSKQASDQFIRIDMSEYQQKHEVSKFIGAPPGYVGYQEGGQLTERLRKCPDAVVLLDEVDKAHPDVLTALLQLFDEGRLTDGKGETIECKEAIFIMTSNLASEHIANHAQKLRKEAALIEQQSLSTELSNPLVISDSFKENTVYPILKKHFLRDEFLGRINEIVYFLPFSDEALRLLVGRELKFWAERSKKTHQMNLEWDSPVVDLLIAGYNEHYGARSLKHEVERRVISLLASAHERGLIGRGSKLRLIVQNGQVVLQKAQEVKSSSWLLGGGDEKSCFVDVFAGSPVLSPDSAANKASV